MGRREQRERERKRAAATGQTLDMFMPKPKHLKSAAAESDSLASEAAESSSASLEPRSASGVDEHEPSTSSSLADDHLHCHSESSDKQDDAAQPPSLSGKRSSTLDIGDFIKDCSESGKPVASLLRFLRLKSTRC